MVDAGEGFRGGGEGGGHVERVADGVGGSHGADFAGVGQRLWFEKGVFVDGNVFD